MSVRPRSEGSRTVFSADRHVKILYISTWLPKQCGIATFSDDLVRSVLAADEHTDYRAIAINDPTDQGLSYTDWAVRCQIDKEDLRSLERAAEWANRCGADVISLQHEFGIWGGFDGEFVLPFLDVLRVPVVLTLHSVPLTQSSFSRANRTRIIREMAARVQHVVTFIPQARDYLIDECGLPPQTVSVLWHGATPPHPADPAQTKERLDLRGRTVLSTYGLLTRFKGIASALRTLPPLIERYPDLIYLILGRPHPAEPTGYYPGLQRLVHDLGLSDHVRFVGHFLESEELAEYLAVTDIYVAPYVEVTQISSGALTHAVAAGRCCVATDFVYARNILSDERGVIVPIGDDAALGGALERLLGDPEARMGYARRAAEFGRTLFWPRIGAQFLQLLRGAADAQPREQDAEQVSLSPSLARSTG